MNISAGAKQMRVNTVISANRATKYLIAKAQISGGFMYETYTHLRIYNTLVLPIMEYGSFLWGFKPLIVQISKVQNNLMRSFLGLYR